MEVEEIMARKQNDDLLIEDELAAAFLNDDDLSQNNTPAPAAQPADDANILEELLDAYKFEHVRAAHRIFAELLDEALPILPPETVVVPLPTIAPHIRQRGYDHTRLIARTFAKRRKLRVETDLRRVGKSKQLGASRRERTQQAKSAYRVTKKLDDAVPYLLLDDVFTTGASLHYAAEALRGAGAREVWVAVIARQPLDK